MAGAAGKVRLLCNPLTARKTVFYDLDSSVNPFFTETVNKNSKKFIIIQFGLLWDYERNRYRNSSKAGSVSMDIADRILLLRGDKTREQFTEGLKTSAQTLYKYETRAGKPTVEFVDQICKKFKISYAWLITGEGPMHPDDTAPTPQPQAQQPEAPPEAATCARCAKLEAELEREKEERRELSAENRELWKKTRGLRMKTTT